MKKTDSDKLARAYDETIQRIWDTFFPGVDIDAVASMKDAASVAKLPIKKCTPACPLYDQCEIRKQYSPSYCPMEFVKFFEQLTSMAKELDIDPDNVVEASRVLDYQLLSLIQDALLEKIQHDGVGRTVPIVSGEGIISEVEEVSPFVKALMEIAKLKGKILEEFLATRQSKKKFGEGEDSDPARFLSGLPVVDAEVEDIERKNDDKKTD